MNIKKMLIELLQNNGPMTRNQLCEAFGFDKYPYQHIQPYMRGNTLIHYHRDGEQFHSRTTLYDNLTILRKQGKVEKFPRSTGKKGRPPIFWRVLEV